jgi:23S rRNA (adenine2503-C2)-methyltransferase
MLATALKTNLFGLDREEMEKLAERFGEAPFRGRQMFHAIYGHRNLNLKNMTDLSRQFRVALLESCEIAIPTLGDRQESRDGAVRHEVVLAGGDAVESVYMPEANRVTLCISSQVGCAVDCHFCFTALMGLKRNLTVGEIVGQVIALMREHAIAPSARLNVVFMGMGEPLLNFRAAMKAIRIMAERDGLAIPERRMTLSTAGIIPGIRALGREPVRPKLAVSLNATTDEQRSRLMPLNRKYPLSELVAACRDYPLRPRERLTFEYVLLDGINDSPEDAERVACLIRGLRAKVNLIPYNPGTQLPYRPPPFERVVAFQKSLTCRRVPAFIRISRGQDIRGACGQLMLDASS